MSIPFRQQLSVGWYLFRQRMRGRSRYPLVLMLEPLFRCNLACAGCGKIDYPDHILNRRLSVDECIAAAEECGAPIVSIAGGEPLIHRQMPQIVSALVARRKFVYLCTNALLLHKHMADYRPSPYLTFSVHLDGNQERHDTSVCRSGVFDQAVEAIRAALSAGFRVTVNSTFFQHETAEEIAEFFDFVTELGVEGITMSPGFSYAHAPQQDVFLERRASVHLFRSLFRLQREGKRRWPLNHSSLFLDFLAGNQPYRCTAWGNPTRNIFGWQRPCYLLADGGYAESFEELMHTTRWQDYGSGVNPKCGNCMAHCGYEPTAVNDTFAHPWKALRAWMRGPRTEGAITLPDAKAPTARPVIPIAPDIARGDIQPHR